MKKRAAFGLSPFNKKGIKNEFQKQFLLHFANGGGGEKKA
jgi:hypothetical protein